jgi:hypothetical protein
MHRDEPLGCNYLAAPPTNDSGAIGRDDEFPVDRGSMALNNAQQAFARNTTQTIVFI